MSNKDSKELDKARILRLEEISTIKGDCKKQITKIRATFGSAQQGRLPANITHLYKTIKEATPYFIELQKIAQIEGTATTQEVFNDVFNGCAFAILMKEISLISNTVCDLRDDEDDTLWNFCHASIQSINKKEETSKRLVELLNTLKPLAIISFPAENQDTPLTTPITTPQAIATESQASTSEEKHGKTATSEQPPRADQTTVTRGRGFTAIWNNAWGRKSSTVNPKANDTPSPEKKEVEKDRRSTFAWGRKSSTTPQKIDHAPSHTIPVSSSSMNLSTAHPKPTSGADKSVGETKETRSSVTSAPYLTFVGGKSFSNIPQPSNPAPTPANNTNTGVDVYIFDETGEVNKTPDEPLTMMQ